MIIPIPINSLRRITLRSILFGVSMLAWSLWFGATIAVFVFVKHFFAVFPKDVAGTAANAMFNSFAHYELALAGIALLSSGLLLVSYPTTKWVLVLGCLVLSSGMAVTVALGLIPMMNALIDEGKQHSPEFIKLHVKSMIAMTLQSGMLLLTGAVMLMGDQTPEIRNQKSESNPNPQTRSGRMFVDG
jgi:carbon starvation protein CstA